MLLVSYFLIPRYAAEGEQEEFLGLVNEFVEDWKKAREDNVRLAKLNQKLKEREDKLAREKMAKEEKTKRLMAMGGKTKNFGMQQVEDVMVGLRNSGAFKMKK